MMGDVSFDAATAATWAPPFLDQSMELARITASSPAFRTCVESAWDQPMDLELWGSVGPHSCSDEPSTLDLFTLGIVLRGYNDVEFNYHGASLGIPTFADPIAFSHSQTIAIKWSDHLIDLVVSALQGSYPGPLIEATWRNLWAVMLSHDLSVSCPVGTSSVYIATACMEAVLSRSEELCGGLDSCGEGELRLVDGIDSSSCMCVQDRRDGDVARLVLLADDLVEWEASSLGDAIAELSVQPQSQWSSHDLLPGANADLVVQLPFGLAVLPDDFGPAYATHDLLPGEDLHGNLTIMDDGDFDGDGRGELLARDIDGLMRIEVPEKGDLVCGNSQPSQCTQASSCSCLGCSSTCADPTGEPLSDCTCEVCENDPSCGGASACDANGICDPFFEGPDCADCRNHEIVIASDDAWGSTLDGGWRITPDDGYFVGNFASAAGTEVLVQSDWGIGVLHYAGGWKTLALAPHGTAIGSVTLGASDRIVGIGDFDADGLDEIAVQGDWGLGMIELGHNSFDDVFVYAYGSELGRWRLRASDEVVGVGRFNGGRSQLLMRGERALGVLEYNTSDVLTSFKIVELGTQWGAFSLPFNTKIEGIGDMTKDGRDEIIARSPWGLGILSAGWTSGDAPTSLLAKPYGHAFVSVVDDTPWELRPTDILHIHKHAGGYSHILLRN